MKTCVNIALCAGLTIAGVTRGQSATAPPETPLPQQRRRSPQRHRPCSRGCRCAIRTHRDL